MKFTPVFIQGSYRIELEKKADSRGFFARAFDVTEFRDHGLVTNFVQDNISESRKAGTIRGLHYQKAPHGEAKFIRAIRGRVFSVCVDLRPASKTFMKWQGTQLSVDEAIYVPEGCANGYQALTDNAAVLYSASHIYTPEAEAGIRWNDPAFGIVFPLKPVVISDKDNAWPDYDNR